MIAADKRWRDRAQRWVAPGAVFNPRAFSVEERDAKRFVVEHHYSGSYPAARLACGLFMGTRLAGVAVFSVPMNQRVIPRWTGLAPSQGVELGRFVLAPDVAYNGESWFLRRAFSLLRAEKPAVRAVISYADPLERRAGAVVVKAQHWGTIYQASNALFAGPAEPRTLLLSPSGLVISQRALAKVRSGDQGWRYAERQLLDAGAPARGFGESVGDWLDRALLAPGFRRHRHPGNLTYLFGLDDRAKAALRALHRGGLAYPKAAA